MTDPLMSQRTNGGGGGYSSAGLTWPRRVRPNSLSFRPLRSATPGQSPEGSMDSTQPSLSQPIQQRPGYVSPLRAVRTLKEYDQEIDALRKENFNLKLSLYFLERDMEKMTNPRERETVKVNLQLRIEAETLRKEVANKSAMLNEAMVALEKLHEKHRLDLQNSKQIQVQLEEQIEALKQELERMETPRSSDPGSEICRQAFGMEENRSSAPKADSPWDRMKLDYFSEVEKFQCTIDEKDKEIKNMRTVIDDLEKKNSVLEEKVRKRNIAIQGLVQHATRKEKSDSRDHPEGSLQKSLMLAIEAAHTGNRESVLSNVDDIRRGLSGLLSVPGSEVTLVPSEDVAHFKSEILRRDETIQSLQEQLFDQTRRVRSLEGNSMVPPVSSGAVLEQECERLQKAVREKDHFIQELLDERTKMTSEHEKTVQNLLLQLQNQSESDSGKIKDSDIYSTESLKMLQELIHEKDAEIDVRKETIEMLNFQLAKCQSELQAAIISNEEKERKLLELSDRSRDLQNELTEIQLEMRALKAMHQNSARLSARDPFESDQSDVLRPDSGEISKPLIDFDDSVKSISLPEKKHASLSEIKELQRSLKESMPVGAVGNEGMEFHVAHSSSRGACVDDHLQPNLPSVSGVSHHRSPVQQPPSVRNKEISETICVRTPRNETIKLSFNVSTKTGDNEKTEELLDIMENNIEEFERQKLLQQLEDQNIEIDKLGKRATLQEDMASVLAEDKKRLQQEIVEKASEIHMLTAGCSELEKQVVVLQSQLHSAVKRADKLERIVHKSKPKAPVLKTSVSSQTDSRKILTQDSESNTSFSDLSLTTFGQSDSVNTLKEEMCILSLVVEEKEKEIHLLKQSNNKLNLELENMVIQSSNTSQLFSDYSEGLSAVHQQLNESQNINSNLFQHLQEVARFLESLLPGKGARKLDASSLTPEAVDRVMKHIVDSLELSGNLSQNLTSCEESKIFDPDCSRVVNETLRYPLPDFFTSSIISKETDEGFMSTFRTAEHEGSELQVVPHRQNANGTGKSWKQASMMQHKTAMETVVETIDSDQLTILGASCSDEGMCCVNEEEKVPILGLSDELKTVSRSKKCGSVRSSLVEVEMRKKYLSHLFEDAVQFECDLHPQHLCWHGQDGEIAVRSCLRYPSEMDAVLPLKVYQKCNGVPCCNISSDSDIWSEPDRNLSLQRIGIDLEAPLFHTRSPPKRRRSHRDRQFSDDCSSDNSFSVNGIPKGKSCPRRKKSIGSFRSDVREPKLDTLMESRLLALERSIEDKLTYVQKVSETVQGDLSGLTELADESPNQTHALMNINEEIQSLQSALANAVQEVRILKDTTQESSQLSRDRSLTEELKLYNEEILSKIDNIDQMKEILVKERYARESAERNLYLCHQELLAVKRKLDDAMRKLQEESRLQQNQGLVLKKGIQGLEHEVVCIPKMSEAAGALADVQNLSKSLAQEEERNAFLKKQVNDILNENKKLKIECEQQRLQLMGEQRNLEEVRQQLMSEQDMVKNLSREKNASESKSADLAADLMRVRTSLTELQDQNKALNKQVSDLVIENKKIKLKVEESEMQLNSEREQAEKLSLEHLHKQEGLTQLAKNKLLAETKIAGLTAEVEALKTALSQKEDQNSNLNKQVNDLRNDNLKTKKELEQLELRLRTEVEHLEAMRKAKKDLHQRNLDLTTEKGDLEKRLCFSEEQMRVLSEEKTDLGRQVFEEQRERKNLFDKVKLLEDQKVLLEKEIGKYKIEIHSSDSICDEAKHDLKHTKEKLKKLEQTVRQYENELSKATSSNEHLMSEKKSLMDDLESLASKVAELSKQNGETKKLLKQRTNNYNELERERSSLIDQVESLSVKKVQAEASRDKLLSEYDSLVTKVDNLEHQVKDSELSLQKNKDEQTHLRQQATSLHNKIKLKETVIKDLEEQHDVLHEQLKELQHSLNKNEIDLKHLEDENESLEQQILTFQKQMKKTSSRLGMKDEEISHLQEDIFNLEQKMKDKEAAQKRILDEKKASDDQISFLQEEVRKQESVHKHLRQQAEELKEQASGLQVVLSNRELLRKQLEEETKSLLTKVDEKEKSVKKLESVLKKTENKLSSFQDINAQLQQRMKQIESTSKLSDVQTAIYREELNKMRETMLVKLQREEPATTDHMSKLTNDLKIKDEYIKDLENKLFEYQKEILSLQRKFGRVTPVPRFREPDVKSSESMQMSLIPNKVFSEPRSSQDYRLHTESRAQEERDNLIKGFELDNCDLKHQLQVLNKKLDMAEKVKTQVQEENVSLWKTLYGTKDENTDIIKTLELKNNDLKKQVENLGKEVDSFEKRKQELEEEKNYLWNTLYGKDGEETDMIKRLEQKNKELRDQFEVYQSKLREAEESKRNLREEKDTLWKTVHGKKDEKTELLKNLQLKNNNFKCQIEEIQKKLDASEKAKCELDEEKNSLWKALYGQHDEKSDITKVLEEKNKELKVKVEVLEKELSHCEEAKADIEEKKDTLWKTLYGSQDEKTEAMKMMEEKNNELKNQISILEKALNAADKTRIELEIEKDSMWKTLCGSGDEKTDLLHQMEMKNTELKGEIESLKRELVSSEKAHKEKEEETIALWKTLYGSEHEQADIIRSLEVKNSDLKGQVHVLETKLEASEKVKKDLEDRIDSLRLTLYGSEDEKAGAVRSIELKNSDLLAQVEVLKKELSDLEKIKNEVEEEKVSLWRTLCGEGDEKADVMRRMEQKNNDLSDQIKVLEKNLSTAKKTAKEMEDEKNSLWKTLHGNEDEKSDMFNRLEQKNKDLNEEIGRLERKLDDAEKAQKSLTEDKNSLWMALNGSDDEKTTEIKSLEMKNSDLKSQLEILEQKLRASEKLKSDFEEEKNLLWKNMYGSQDEKASTIKKLNMEISNLKSVIQNLENNYSALEKVKDDLEAENSSLNEKLSKSIEESANITNKLELKDSDLKNQVKMLEDKLRVSDDLKKAIEEDRNSLYKQLLGDSSGEKLEGMLKETQIYINQVKKLEQEINQKNALLIETKEKLFVSENSLSTQQSVVEHLNIQVSSYKTQLEQADAEREWFQKQYIDSQREVIRVTQPAATPGGEIREEDMVVVHQQTLDLKKQVADLLAQAQEKDTLSLPPLRPELFVVELPTLPDEKMESSVDRRFSSEMKHAELEKLQIEKNYLQKVLMDLKKQVESQPPRPPDSDVLPQKVPIIQRQPSGFTEAIAKHLAHQGSPDGTVEKIKQLQSERDFFKKLADELQTELQLYTSSLREKGPTSFSEAENAKLSKENADLKGKVVELHSRVKKRESLIMALSNKVVELEKLLEDSHAIPVDELNKIEKDDVSLLATQIAEETSKAAERKSSEDIVIPSIDSFGFEAEEDSQLLSLLHPGLRLSIPQESETPDLDSKGVQKLRYQIEELENQLEDTIMDNYRLQEEVSTLLLKFGIQNNRLVCEKCGKSADIVSTQPSTFVKSASKFTSFRSYLEKDPMFSKEERINKLGECKWKLQNEVLNMQKKLCIHRPSYLENQESFNNHIAKIVSMEYPKIPVRIFSEPLLPAAESQDVVKNAERLKLLWKGQVLHLERDIRCLQNYRMFLEQFVLGLMKDLTEATKKKPVVVSSGTDVKEQQAQILEPKFPGPAVSKPSQTQGVTVPAVREMEVRPVLRQPLDFPPESEIQPRKAISSQEAQLLQNLTAERAVDRSSVILEPKSSVHISASETSVTRKSQRSSKPGPDVLKLQNEIKELDKRIEELQAENKRLQDENNSLSSECKKRDRGKDRVMEKQIEELKHSLKNMKSVKKSLRVELDTYRRMFEEDGDKPDEKSQAGYLKKSDVANLMNEVDKMTSNMSELTEENDLLRKKIAVLSSPSRDEKSKVLQPEESSSDKESEVTVTVSRSGSLSSVESTTYVYGHPKSKKVQESRDLLKSYAAEVQPFSTTWRRKQQPETSQELMLPRSEFSSPDLGIESDPNHELFTSEQEKSDEKSYIKTYPFRTKLARPTSDTVAAAMSESAKTSLNAMGPLKDFNLLKKEIEESVILIKGIYTKAKKCVEHLSKGSNPQKNIGYTTLKELMSALSEVHVCQVKAHQLLQSFWETSGETSIDVTTLLEENQELVKTLENIMEERKNQKLELEQAFERLREAKVSKEKMEKAITKQLTRTKKVLKCATTKLEAPQQRPGTSAPQQRNHPSSSSKPSTK